MKLKCYMLNEAEVTQVLTYDKARYILKKKCSEALEIYQNHGVCIYRGATFNGPFILKKPSQGSRVSANTSNHYTLLIDNLPCWKGYPKRSKSLVCSFDYYVAESYGSTTYNVFPYNGSTIGICPHGDLWTSFESIGISYLDQFNNHLRDLGLVDTSWNALVKSSKRLDKNKKNLEVEHTEKILKDYVDSMYTFIDYMNIYFNPNKNGFKKVKTDSIMSVNFHGSEMWTDGDCLLIEHNEEHNNIDWLLE